MRDGSWSCTAVGDSTETFNLEVVHYTGKDPFPALFPFARARVPAGRP